MADLFISYASEDRDFARALAKALGDSGWSIWWDREIITGQTFDDVIERELDAAKGVVVLWSKHSIASDWVRNEAGVAAERGVLLPANIDGTRLPLEFRRRQTAVLKDWAGETSHPGLRRCARASAACLGATGRQPSPLRHRYDVASGPGSSSRRSL